MQPNRVASEVTLAVESPDSEVSLAIQQGFFVDIASRYPGWTPASSQSVHSSDLSSPVGVWLVAYLSGRAVGCGGLQHLDAETSEIRRLYLDQRARSRGIGRALLAQLEDHARRLGYQRVRLTTGDAQPEALGLFRSAGYEEIEPFTDGAFTSHWMEKQLSGGQAQRTEQHLGTRTPHAVVALDVQRGILEQRLTRVKKRAGN